MANDVRTALTRPVSLGLAALAAALAALAGYQAVSHPAELARQRTELERTIGEVTTSRDRAAADAEAARAQAARLGKRVAVLEAEAAARAESTAGLERRLQQAQAQLAARPPEAPVVRSDRDAASTGVPEARRPPVGRAPRGR